MTTSDEAWQTSLVEPDQHWRESRHIREMIASEHDGARAEGVGVGSRSRFGVLAAVSVSLAHLLGSGAQDSWRPPARHAQGARARRRRPHSVEACAAQTVNTNDEIWMLERDLFARLAQLEDEAGRLEPAWAHARRAVESAAKLPGKTNRALEAAFERFGAIAKKAARPEEWESLRARVAAIRANRGLN